MSDDKKIKLEILGLSSSQSESGSFVLVLGEEGGNRKLPIIIGMSEAQSIAIEIEGISPNRPMTHDLFKTFSHHFDIEIKEVYISELKEGVFFASIICEHHGKIVEIDARPSDAIAIGIRFDVDFHTNQTVMNEASVDVALKDDEQKAADTKHTKTIRFNPPKNEIKIKDLSPKELEEILADALDKEDYEKAARIRDELNKRN